MTAKFSKNKRTKSIFLLAVTFILALCLCFITACSDEDDSTTTETTSKTDNCAIANGNFEYYTDDDNTQLIVSPASWTKSNGQDDNGNSAASSSRKSGIVNTKADVWDSVTKEKTPFAFTDDMDAKKAMTEGAKVWDKMSIYDRIAFYDTLEDKIEKYNETHDDTLSLSDFEKYDDSHYQIDKDDIPTVSNPLTHNATGVNEDETSVLMIHNYRTDGYGTAQKFTSSTTVTLKANTAAKISVWVKTADLKYDNGSTVDGNRGANICVTHTVGGKTLDQMQIKNIDTADVTENNGWKQYTVYVKACTYASSTFTVVLGLGQGSTKDNMEYVEGYAFFDDVDMDVISVEDYETAITTAGANLGSCDLRSAKEQKQFATDTTAYADIATYALDLSASLQAWDINGNTTTNVDLTKTIANNVEYTTDNYVGLGFDRTDDIYSKTTLAALRGTTNNKYLNKILADDFDAQKFPFAESENMIFMMSARGAAYTATMTQASDFFTLGENDYLLLSFWVKTSDTSGYTGATVTLKDGVNNSTLGSYNTTTMATVDLDDKEDIYDGWVQCFFFIENGTFTDKTFSLEFSYGPTTITGTTKTSYCEGYAAFTGFQYATLTAAEFKNYAGSASQSTSVTLKGDKVTGEGFDSVSNIDKQKLEDTLANTSAYKGVEGGSKQLGGETLSPTNANENAGLLNKDYAGAYFDNNATWFTNLTAAASSTVTGALDKANWWNTVFGTSTQPLLISNVVEQSYGYFSTNYNLSANGYSTISVKVMVSANAKAYIYLVDTSDQFKGYGDLNKLETTNVTYWYDADGNVCLLDPTDDDFNVQTDTAFYRAENGLFKNNLNKEDTNVYANLLNYEKDGDGNLIAKKDSNNNPVISYDYTDEYVDDGIAFYFDDNKYYAYYNAEKDAYETEVKDFSQATINGKNFTTEYARYISKDFADANSWTVGDNVVLTNTAETDTYVVVDGATAGVAMKWVTVRFYVRTGSGSFPYRLEVFSGSRDGSVKNPAGSFVAFDKVSSEALSDSYDGLVKEAIEDMTDVNGYQDTRTGGTVKLVEDDETGRLIYADGETKAGQTYEHSGYYTYTFYDDPAFRRYDRSLDTEEKGNPYHEYIQTDKTEEMTYLYYESQVAGNAEYCMFLNYNAVSQSVTADEGLDTEDTEDEENKWWEDANFWWMLSSILLAVVLVIVMLVVLIVKMVKRSKRSGNKQNNHYSSRRSQYIRKLDLQTEDEDEPVDQTSETAETPADDNNPYND